MRRLIKKSFPGTCAYYLADDVLKGLRFRAGKIDTESGTAHAGRSTDSSVQYIERVFADYKQYSGMTRFNGRVAEVGPGDNSGVGLMFLADGCRDVDLVDRFYSKRNVEQHTEVYRALVAQSPVLVSMCIDDATLGEASFPGLRRHYGPDASAEEFFLHSSGYDLIVSRAVLEHVYDPTTAIRRMAAALTPGGMLLHKVDLRDHGMFSEFFHELKFLEVPDSIYPAMSRGAGRPNRVLVHRYRLALDDVMPEHDILVTRLAGVGDIDPHLRYEHIASSLRERAVAYVRSVRHRFARSFRAVSDEDLSVAGIFITARNTGAR